MPWLPSNPLVPSCPDPHATKWDALRARYGDDLVFQHVWQLIGSELMPLYDMQPVKTIVDVWHEFASGLNSFLPVRELEENFGSKWRFNIPKVKTAWSRRSKVYALVEALCKKPRWNIDLALHFLQDTYSSTHTASKFCAWLQKTDAHAHKAVLKHAESYP